jgi:hypothetical protein
MNALDGIVNPLVTERFVKLIFKLTFAILLLLYGKPFMNATDKLLIETLDALINEPVTIVLPFINCVAVVGPVYNIPPMISVDTDKLFTDVFVAVINDPVIDEKDPLFIFKLSIFAETIEPPTLIVVPVCPILIVLAFTFPRLNVLPARYTSTVGVKKLKLIIQYRIKKYIIYDFIKNIINKHLRK